MKTMTNDNRTKEDQNYIYAIRLYDDVANNPSMLSNGTLIGWFKSEDETKTIVLNNTADMHETCYDCALIEKVGWGVYCRAEERCLFTYHRAKKGYEKIDLPEDLSVKKYPYSLTIC